MADQAQIDNYYAEKRRWQAKLENYRADYALIVNQEAILAQVGTILENSNYLFRVFESSVEQIEDISNEVEIPNFKDIFDFEELKEQGGSGSKLAAINEACLNDVQQSGRQLDTLKTELASKILEAQNAIEWYSDRIYFAQYG